MEEHTFFEHNDIKVTNTRFITGGQTYAMSNVTSVKTFEEKPRRFAPMALLFLGISISIIGNLLVGGIFVAVISYYIYKQKSVYHVMLSTSGGETSALKTDKAAYLTQVVEAINQAIVHRG